MPELRTIALADIDEPPLAARVEMDEGKLTDLMQSMTSIGLMQPIGVKSADARFEIEFGHRRFVAATRLGWHHITALVFKPGEIIEGAAMLAENIHREELSAAEEAILFAQSQEKLKLDEAGLCARFHVSPDYLADRLRLLRMGGRVFDSLLARRINFSVARELNKCEDEAHRNYLLDIAERSGTSARVVADYVRQWRVSASPNPVQTPAPPPDTVPVQAEVYVHACALCGGGKDPWNLVTVTMHKWEWEMIQRQVNKSIEEQES